MFIDMSSVPSKHHCLFEFVSGNCILKSLFKAKAAKLKHRYCVNQTRQIIRLDSRLVATRLQFINDDTR